MATENNTNNNKSTTELRKWYADYSSKQEVFAAVNDALKLIDLTKTETRSFTVFSKELLRNYMKNPKSNESNLRNLSKFLYRLSHPYRRLLNYNAEMIDLNSVSVIPIIDLVKGNKDDKLLKSYYNTLVELDKIKLDTEIFKCAITAWREDCFYGYVYEDDEGFFIMPLDGDYCKVSSINFDGTLNFAFDFSYFRRHTECLEYWDKEFNSKYNSYSEDNTLRWQELDPTRTICLKVNIDDPTMILPPYLALFESIIDLVDLQSIQSVKDELSIYKLLVARLKPLSGTKNPDDFEVDINTAIAYYNKLSESLPDCVSSCISPLPIEPIEFKGTDTSDVDMISNSMSNLLKLAGGSQILDNQKTGSTIFDAQIMADTLHALKSLLPQIEKWINRYMGYSISDHSKIKYMEVSPYTREKKKKALLESGQNGLPCKLEVAALDGFSPLETLSKIYLENTILNITDQLIPFSTSYTQSGSEPKSDTGGAPEKDPDELTDEGDSTKEKDKNGM